MTAKTLTQVAYEAMAIYEAHDEAAYYDAGFDAGEFSEEAHARLADTEVETLAAANGFSYEQVVREIQAVTDNCEED